MSCDPTLLALERFDRSLDEFPLKDVTINCRRLFKTYERLLKRRKHRKNRRNGFQRSFYDVFG